MNVPEEQGMTRRVAAASFASVKLALDVERWHHGVMAKGKPTPEKPKSDKDDAEKEKPAPEAAADAPKPAEAAAAEKPEPPAVARSGEPDRAASPEATQRSIEPPPPKGEPWPDATPQPMRP